MKSIIITLVESILNFFIKQFSSIDTALLDVSSNETDVRLSPRMPAINIAQTEHSFDEYPIGDNADEFEDEPSKLLNQTWLEMDTVNSVDPWKNIGLERTVEYGTEDGESLSREIDS